MIKGGFLTISGVFDNKLIELCFHVVGILFHFGTAVLLKQDSVPKYG